MATVDGFLIEAGLDIFYDDGFRRVLEDHMTYLRSHSTTTIMQVDPIKAYRFEFDLNGLLLDMGIPLRLHWIVMRMNNLKSFQDVPADLTQLKICDPAQIDMLRQSHQTASKIR